MKTTIFGFALGLFEKEQHISIEHEEIKSSQTHKVVVFYNNKNSDYIDFITKIRELNPIKLNEYKPYMVSRESIFNSVVEYFCNCELK